MFTDGTLCKIDKVMQVVERKIREELLFFH
jgi:hypothetical protein